MIRTLPSKIFTPLVCLGFVVVCYSLLANAQSPDVKGHEVAAHERFAICDGSEG
jgi:hypothetical protein